MLQVVIQILAHFLQNDATILVLASAEPPLLWETLYLMLPRVQRPVMASEKLPGP